MPRIQIFRPTSSRARRQDNREIQNPLNRDDKCTCGFTENFTPLTPRILLGRGKLLNLSYAGAPVERQGQGAVQDGRRRPPPGKWTHQIFLHQLSHHFWNFWTKLPFSLIISRKETLVWGTDRRVHLRGGRRDDPEGGVQRDEHRRRGRHQDQEKGQEQQQEQER